MEDSNGYGRRGSISAPSGGGLAGSERVDRGVGWSLPPLHGEEGAGGRLEGGLADQIVGCQRRGRCEESTL
jgi:hypothetical protein